MRQRNMSALRNIFYSPISILLVCVPLGIASPYIGWSQSVTFWLNFFAMIPLAKILGDATEELADRLNNDMVSGLINATMGNAVEMIMTITFLQKAEYVVIKASMLGSVLSNMLLVMGMSFLCGGFFARRARPRAAAWKGLTPGARKAGFAVQGGQTPLLAGDRSATHFSIGSSQGSRARAGTEQSSNFLEQEQQYSLLGAVINTTMLLVCCLILCLVTVFDHTSDSQSSEVINQNILSISRKCSILIVLAYAAYIVFELYMHP